MFWGLVIVAIIGWAMVGVFVSIGMGRAVRIAEGERADREFMRSLVESSTASPTEKLAG